jgi:hypothetical protein
MTRLLIRFVLFLAIASNVFAERDTPIKAVNTTRLADAVYEAVSMGHVKDTMKCDSPGNIYTPVNRGYSSAYGSVVEISADRKHFVRFSLDAVPHLHNGHVEDFHVADDRSVYLLAREIRKYTELEVPELFGATYVLKYSTSGDLSEQTKLSADYKDQRPTTLAVLSSGDILVAGYSYVQDTRVRVFAHLFTADGRLKKDVTIPGTGVQRSNSDKVSSMSVIRPTIVASDKRLFLLRGSTREPVYVFSETGELIETIRLDPGDIKFSSPMIWNGRLVVHQHQPPLPSGTMLQEARPDVFLIFDLQSGRKVEQYSWKQSGELACYRENLLTIVHNQSEGETGYWVAFQAKPDSGVRPPLRSGPITFQVRRIVSCGSHGNPVPMQNEETGTSSYHCLADSPIVSESDVTSAEIYPDLSNRPGLRLTFTFEGAEKLHSATIKLVHEQVGVVIDGELVFVALVVEPIRNELVVNGKFRADELANWADRLNAQARSHQRLHKL